MADFDSGVSSFIQGLLKAKQDAVQPPDDMAMATKEYYSPQDLQPKSAQTAQPLPSSSLVNTQPSDNQDDVNNDVSPKVPMSQVQEVQPDQTNQAPVDDQLKKTLAQQVQTKANPTVPDYASLLAAAKARRDSGNFGYNMSKVAEDFAKAGVLANRRNPDIVKPSGIWAALHDEGNQGVTDVEEQQKLDNAILVQKQLQTKVNVEEQSQDPNSPYSQVAREQLFKINPGFANNPAFENATASMIDKIYPMLNSQENREARLQQARLHMQQMAEMQAPRLQMQQEKEQAKILGDFGKDLNPYTLRNNTVFGGAAAKSIQADALNQLINDPATIKNMDSVQRAEVEAGLTKFFGGTAGKTYLPKEFKNNAAGAVQWFTGNPTGTDQTEFLRSISADVAKQKQLADAQMNKIRKQAISKNAVAIKKYPDESEKILNSYGLDINGDLLPTSSDAVQGPLKQTTWDTVQSSGAKPATINWNGHDYTLNPATGKYE